MTTNNINPNMTNIEVKEAREQGATWDDFSRICGWNVPEVTKRIMAARNGIETVKSNDEKVVKVEIVKEFNVDELEHMKKVEERKLQIIEDTRIAKENRQEQDIEDAKQRVLEQEIMAEKAAEVRLEKEFEVIENDYSTYRADEYRAWWGTYKGKHEHTVSYMKDAMNQNGIPYNDTIKSGIDFVLPDGRECVVHGLGDDLAGFVIHDMIDKLKGDIFIYVNNMAQRDHIVSIMSKEVVLDTCVSRGADAQSMMPLGVIKQYINNYGILK